MYRQDLLGRKGRNKGCRVNQNHRPEDKRRITQTVIKLLPSVTDRIPVSLATTLNSSSLSSSSSCSPPRVSSGMETTNPSWTSARPTSPPRSCVRPALTRNNYE
ncbi:hypothetical protein PBY51_009282 [Eleginops maclovinus]|uniref:Uncharacterized protein n=1 Tax=Eleginops maclovinus TaxID=56733 RepID=A0AAN7XWM7_ELEMC|nr:hypothetical protein PBY51_009282 [Eleginops maclovinus]